MKEAKLAVGAMSREIIEAVYSYSEDNERIMMLIASTNQIDWDGGYVHNWTTADWVNYCMEMRYKYPGATVQLCRDHCGPNFKSQPTNIIHAIRTLQDDVKLGLDLIHIDLCRTGLTEPMLVHHTKQMMELALDIDTYIEFEVGTEENGFALETDLDEFTQMVESVCEIKVPRYWVVDTGSLVTGLTNRDAYDWHRERVEKTADLLNKFGIGIKEHNADYIIPEQIKKRKDVVSAMNIAPQLGVLHTEIACYYAGVIEGRSTKQFEELVINGGKWKKWLPVDCQDYEKVLAAGHYHFESPEFKELIYCLPNISQTIINEAKVIFVKYLDNF